MYEFDIPSMSCGHCRSTVEKAIASADPSASSTIDLTAKKASVRTAVDPSVISQAIENAGYPVVSSRTV